jgi:hypothetical protein
MDRRQAVNSFDFYDHCVLNKQIQTKVTVQLDSFVVDRYCDLSSEGQAGLAEFVTETFFVRGFQQPGTEMSVDLNGCPDDQISDVIQGAKCLCSLYDLRF